MDVQKSPISKLESSTNSATIDTILKAFKALKADIHFNVTLEKQYIPSLEGKTNKQNLNL